MWTQIKIRQTPTGESVCLARRHIACIEPAAHWQYWPNQGQGSPDILAFAINRYLPQTGVYAVVDWQYFLNGIRRDSHTKQGFFVRLNTPVCLMLPVAEIRYPEARDSGLQQLDINLLISHLANN